jgi:hypothetical protein
MRPRAPRGNGLALADVDAGSGTLAVRRRLECAPGHEKRIAMVIGNADDQTKRLGNPENDARLIADNPRKLGFDVNEQMNLGVLEFRRALRDFARRVQRDDAVAVLYYAGHGMQIANFTFNSGKTALAQGAREPLDTGERGITTSNVVPAPGIECMDNGWLSRAPALRTIESPSPRC